MEIKRDLQNFGIEKLELISGWIGRAVEESAMRI